MNASNHPVQAKANKKLNDSLREFKAERERLL